MKTLLMILMMTTEVAWSQSTTCTKLESNKGTTICKGVDSTGTVYQKFEVTKRGGSSEVITSDDYNRLLNLELTFQADKLAILKDAHAHHEAEMTAMKITNKKDCTKAGFDWQHGACNVKESK